MNAVEVTELIVGDEEFLVAAKDAPSKLLGNVPMSYIWIKMRYEKGRFFLLQWQNPGREPDYYQIPRGLVVGGHKFDMSHNDTIYSETRAVVGHFHSIPQDTSTKMVLVRIFPPR